MARRNRVYTFIVAAIGLLLFFGDVQAAEIQFTDNTSKLEAVMGSGPHNIALVSARPWEVDGEILGMLYAYVYDDAVSERPADYWEIYDKGGDLLAVGWFDKFGIRRTAIDRGIAEQKEQLEGTFVIVLDGDSV